MNLLKTTTLSAIASGLLVLGLGASPTSHASTYVNLSASGACMASSGPGADNFYFSAEYATNTAAVSHYLICDLTMVRRLGTDTPAELSFHFLNPFTTARTVNCVVYTTHNASGGTDSFAFSHSVATNSAHSSEALLGADVPVTASALHHLSMSCLVPAGVSVGSILVRLPGNIPA